MTNPGLIDEQSVPESTHSTIITLAGVEIALHHLDNGQTIIPQDDMVRFLEELASGRARLTEEDMKTVNRIMGPKP